jgi:PEP-CTERM motif
VTVWDGVANRRPSLDGDQPTPVYDSFIQGRGAGLTFTVRDSPYGNNVGGETVSIYQLGDRVSPTTVPEPSTVVLLAAGLLGIGVVARKHRQSV